MRQTSELVNHLRAVRNRLGLSQQDLAQAAGVARQTIGGIEAGLYAPSAIVALRLANALGCRVEELFWLQDGSVRLDVRPIGDTGSDGSSRWLLANVGGKWIAHPLHGKSAFRTELVPADAVGAGSCTDESINVGVLDDPVELKRSVVIAGCTPSLSLWARSAERWYPGLRVHWIYSNSTEALRKLARGEVHAAGVHVFDADSGEHNIPVVRKILGDRKAVLVNLGFWNEGLVVERGNPKKLKGVADLMQAGVVLINRDEGSGARLMLDTLLRSAGIQGSSIPGYFHNAMTHQEVAEAVLDRRADVGISTEAVASTYGLDFMPLQKVRYDMAFLEEYMVQESVAQLVGTLEHRWVRTQLAESGGYDTSMTGQVVRVE